MADMLNLHPEVRRRAQLLVGFFRRHGYKATITSGYRSAAAQAKLYRAYQQCKGTRKEFCLPAATPGRSTHQYGVAVDIWTDAPPEAREDFAANAGLIYAGKSDPVHYDVFGHRWPAILSAAGVS